MALAPWAAGQEILWKGRELSSGTYKIIEGEITIRTAEDTIRASRAVLYQNPRKVVLQGNLSLVRKGARVTGDSGIYYPATKLVEVLGNGWIQTEEGDLKSSRFLYDLNSKILRSPGKTTGSAQGMRFSGNQSRFYPTTKNMWLQGNTQWENDTLKGKSDTLFLNKEAGLLQMSRNAQILHKKKPDRIAGTFLELDLKANKLSRVEGSEIKQGDIRLKAKKIDPRGEDYYLKEDVSVSNTDSSVWSMGREAVIRKKGMEMKGETVTRILDKEKNEIFLYAPRVESERGDSVETYQFYRPTHIRGQFDGFCDSLRVWQTASVREVYLYRQAHIQNDSLYLEGDTLELLQDSVYETIRAKRNALLVLITKPYRINTISAAFIELKKSKTDSRMEARGETESFLWNDEKSNVGINHTRAPEQRSSMRDQKISRVATRGKTESKFQPQDKADLGYVDQVASRLKETYASDSVLQGLPPIKPFLRTGPDKRSGE